MVWKLWWMAHVSFFQCPFSEKFLFSPLDTNTSVRVSSLKRKRGKGDFEKKVEKRRFTAAAFANGKVGEEKVRGRERERRKKRRKGRRKKEAT